MQPNATDSCSILKKELNAHWTDSCLQEIRQLLSGEEIGNRKSSHVLRNKKCYAEFLNVPLKLILQLFLQRLPSSVQSILASVSVLTLEKSAEISDRISEVISSLDAILAVFCSNEQSINEKLFKEIKKEISASTEFRLSIVDL